MTPKKRKRYMKLKTEKRYEFVARIVDARHEALTAKQVKSMINPHSWKAPLAVVQATLNNAVQKGILAKSKIDGVKYIHYHPVSLNIAHGTLITEKHSKNMENKTTRVNIETNDIDGDDYTDEELASMPYSVVLNKAKAEYDKRNRVRHNKNSVKGFNPEALASPQSVKRHGRLITVREWRFNARELIDQLHELDVRLYEQVLDTISDGLGIYSQDGWFDNKHGDMCISEEVFE